MRLASSADNEFSVHSSIITTWVLELMVAAEKRPSPTIDATNFDEIIPKIYLLREY